jgi:hypothetical protein
VPGRGRGKADQHKRDHKVPLENKIFNRMFAEEFLSYTTDLKLMVKEAKVPNLRPISSISN